jgi:hypothetical protein
MDFKAYIDSGVLELYVSGLLSETEAQQVEEYATHYPEVQQEIDAIRSSVNNYARRSGRAPSSSILDGALSQIRDNSEQTESDSEAEQKPTNESVSISTTRDWFKIAASIALLISVGINGYFFNELQNAQNDQAEANQQIATLSNQLDVVTSAANMEIPLYGLDVSPKSHATVYINEQTRDVYIKIGDLPVPPSGHQYQLWADRDGHMHNIGVFHHNKSLQHLTVFDGDFESLNVTLEEEGGSETATVERAYLSGKATS